MQPTILPIGDSALRIAFYQEISEAVHRNVLGLKHLLEQAEIPGLERILPGYNTLLVQFNGLEITASSLCTDIRKLLDTVTDIPEHAGRRVTIPVCYTPAFGPDLESTADHAQITVDQLIQRHTAGSYPVYMLGFAPGFPYLGGMDTSISAPRLLEPRLKIPGGSVGIAGEQTGVYPLDSPGGWRIIGRTPLRLFDPEREEPFLLQAGDKIWFTPITEREYEERLTTLKQTSSMQALNDRSDIEVQHAGFYATVQDMGREEWLHMGVPRSGCADPLASRSANALVGNDLAEALMEFTMIGGKLAFHRDTRIAITGAFMHPHIDGTPVPQWQSLDVKKGQTLTMGAATVGMRTYVSVAGGLDIPKVLGSRSTYPKARLGGLEGRPLQAGDFLNIDKSTKTHSLPERHQAIRIGAQPDYGHVWKLRVIEGPQCDRFTDSGVTLFYGQEFTVSQQLDRMGIRLSGSPVSHTEGADILSEPILPGAVQIPGNGLPILMSVDAQTAGGYTKIAQVITADLWKLGQLRPGDMVQFEQVDLERAYLLRSEYEATLDQLTRPEAFRMPAAFQNYKVTIDSTPYDVIVEPVES